MQAASRFIVRAEKTAMGQILNEMTGRKILQSAFGTPRLFQFTASRAQIKKAHEEKRHDLYGQKIGVDVPFKLAVKLGLQMAKPLSNRRILQEGASLWVAATPSLSYSNAKELREMRLSPKRRYDDAVAFLMLQVTNRAQYASLDVSRYRPLHEINVLQPA